MLTEAQLVALEKAKTEKEAVFESEHPGTAAPRTRSMSATFKGVGRVYQQTFIDTYSKGSLVPSSMIADPDHGGIRSTIGSVSVLRPPGGQAAAGVLCDRGSEYCRQPGAARLRLYLAVEDIDHSAHRDQAARRPTASASASTRPC